MTAALIDITVRRAAEVDEVPRTDVAVWRRLPVMELRWTLELTRLLLDPVALGRGVPRGDGRPVLLLPGFLAADASLAVLGRFLRRIGYRPVQSGIPFNSGCGEEFDSRITARLVAEHERAGRRVAIVGHSRGGHYARSLAVRYPQFVSHVVSLGAGLDEPLDVSMPVRAAATAMREIVTRCDGDRRALGCLTPGCACEFSRGYAQPFPANVRLTSIYSRSDGVVRWRSCLADYATCVEVPGSHIGMAFSRHAYRAIARALAEPEAE